MAHKIRSFSDEEFAIWLAGFFDGEGCIYLPEKTGIAVTVSNTNRAVIAAIYRRMNCGIFQTTEFLSQKRWKTKYTWILRQYEESGRVIRMMYPYLTIKKRKADEALKRIDRVAAETKTRMNRNKSIFEMAQAGMTHQAIADQFGLCRSGVSIIVAWVKEFGPIPLMHDFGKALKTCKRFRRKTKTVAIQRHAKKLVKVKTRSVMISRIRHERTLSHKA